MLKLFNTKVMISSYNLTDDELTEFISFWEENKKLSTVNFVKELQKFIKANKLFDGCTIDMSCNDVSLTRRNLL